LKEALAVHALNALVGNINQAGGVQTNPAYAYIQWPEDARDTVAAAGLQTRRADHAGADLYAEARHLPHRFMENVSKGSADIQALLVGETNPCYGLPNAADVKAAFEKIPFVVSFSSFMDETSSRADLILPNHLYLERYEDVPVTAATAQPLIGLCRPVTRPQYRTQHMGDSLIQIARGIGGPTGQALSWSDYEACLHETMADQWAALSRQGYLMPDNAAGSTDRFETPSGKFVFMDKTLNAAYLSKKVPLPGDAAQMPLLLIPYDSIRMAGRYVADPPFMMKIVPTTVLKNDDGWVEINPQTAAQYDLAEGRSAVLTTPAGQARVRVHHNHGLMPGVIAMARGLGHTDQNPYVAGKGTNINHLMEAVEDPASGMNAAWGIRAQLAKA
jgi:anaerobic selenocysteine-containing dehydrogenase